MSNDVLLMAGKVWLNRLTDAGESTGYLDPSETAKLAIGEEAEIKTLKSKGRDTYGQVIAAVTLKKTPTLELTLMEVNPRALAMALLGDLATGTQQNTYITDDPVTLIPGMWVPLTYRDLSPSGAVSVSAGNPPSTVPSTDYQMNFRLGMIRYIGTDFTVPTPAVVSYQLSSVSWRRIAGSVRPTVRVSIILDGKNLVSGKDVRVIIDEATITPTKAIDFMSDDWAELAFKGEMRTLPNKTSPYIVEFIG